MLYIKASYPTVSPFPPLSSCIPIPAFFDVPSWDCFALFTAFVESPPSTAFPPVFSFADLHHRPSISIEFHFPPSDILLTGNRRLTSAHPPSPAPADPARASCSSHACRLGTRCRSWAWARCCWRSMGQRCSRGQYAAMRRWRGCCVLRACCCGGGAG